MSTLIYKSEIQTVLGQGEVRITDTNPGALTPDLHRAPARSSISLNQGDTAAADSKLPSSIGSYFDLTFPDNADYEFQRLFRSDFAEGRYEVTLEIPSTGTWEGYVEKKFTKRYASRDIRRSTVTVTCYDAMAALSEEPPVQKSRKKTLRQVLVDIFAAANADLDIALYVDPSPNDPNGTQKGTDERYPRSELGLYYSPKTGQPRGLTEPSKRGQLNKICRNYVASAYQDVKLGAWVVMDIPSIGAPVTGVRYDGSSWSSYTFPDQTVTVRKKDVYAKGSKQLEQLPPVQSVSTPKISALSIDERHEQFPKKSSTDVLYHWTHPDSLLGELGGVFDDEGTNEIFIDHNNDGDRHEQNIYVEFSLDNVDGIVQEWISSSSHDFINNIFVYYGDGSQTGSITPFVRSKQDGEKIKNTKKYRQYFPLDDTKDRVVRLFQYVELKSSGPNVYETRLIPVEKNTRTGPDGNDVYKFEPVDLKYQTTDFNTGRSVKDEAGGAVVGFDSGKVSPKNWDSTKLAGTFQTMWDWRSSYLIKLQTLDRDRFDATLRHKSVPLGTRVKYEKPDDDFRTTFVPMKGRVLRFGNDEGEGLETKVKDVEVPKAVLP